MTNKSRWIFLFLFVFGFSLHAHSEEYFNNNSDELIISIPYQTKMWLYGPDDYELVSFRGELEIKGTIIARSIMKELDGEKELRINLLFKPYLNEIKLIPKVRYKSENSNDNDNFFIELNYFKKNEILNSIETIFGENALHKIKSQPIEFAKEGSLILDNYRTGVECDRRYFYANFVSFNSLKNLSKEQVKMVTNKILSSCS